MTYREFLLKVKENVEDADVQSYCDNAIEKLDNKNKARSSKPSKTQIANEPIKANIVELVANTESEEGLTASAIGQALEISTQKASALCRQLVGEGKLVAKDIKVKGKGKQKAYSVA